MKKLSVLLIAALLISMLAGCSIQQSIQGMTDEAKNLPILEMVQLLADRDETAFMSHFHPSVSDDTIRNGFTYMADYLRDVTPVLVECLGSNSYSGIGTNGKYSSVSASYLVTFEMGSVLIDAEYIENMEGSGFTQFLCKFGIAQ